MHRISEATKLHLTKKEWSMGNGQCYECCGLKPGFGAGSASPATADETGHKRKCWHAKMLVELGFTVHYIKKGK